MRMDAHRLTVVLQLSHCPVVKWFHRGSLMWWNRAAAMQSFLVLLVRSNLSSVVFG